MLALCSNDAVIDTLRGVFHANIVAVPEARIEPLIIAAASKDGTSFRGAILPLLKKPSSFTKPPVMQSAMPSISATRTREISLKSGLQILGNFLTGFGVPSVDLSVPFSGVSKISFSFNNVVRFFVDVNELGERVVGSTLDRDNPSAAIFFAPEKNYRCYILDSAITSSDFTIRVEKSNKADFEIDVPTISTIISKANTGLTVSRSSNVSVTFQGDKQLGFAFSCVRATFDNTGKFTSMEPGGQIPTFESLQDSEVECTVAHTPDHVLLSRDPVMLAADFSSFVAERETATVV